MPRRRRGGAVRLVHGMRRDSGDRRNHESLHVISGDIRVHGDHLLKRVVCQRVETIPPAALAGGSMEFPGSTRSEPNPLSSPAETRSSEKK